MGSCVSSLKCSTPNSATQSPPNHLVVTESSYGDPASTFESHGSKEETFFNSLTWLEPEFEDDFLSVKEDFTPTCGNSPVHSSMGIPSSRNATTPPMPEPSPTSRGEQQSSSELSTSADQHGHDLKGEPKATVIGLPKSNQTSPYASGTVSFSSNKRVANEDIVTERDKSVTYSRNRCLLSLISCSTFRERKKTTPVVAVDGKA